MRIDSLVQPVRRQMSFPDEGDAILLPSERSVRELLRMTDDSDGEVDRHALFRQLRPGPAPRWFLYDPVRACDEVQWTSGPTISFEMWYRGAVTTKILTRTPSAWAAYTTFRAPPVILPSPLRERVRDLAARGIQTYLLYEPTRVVARTGRTIRLPERVQELALVVEHDESWFLVERYSLERPRGASV